MPVSVLKRITRRIRKVVTETPPPSSVAPAPVVDAPRNPRASVSGRLCLRSATALHARLFKHLEGSARAFALDVSRVRFLDGSALAVLVEFAQACRRRGITLTLIRPSAQVWNTFSLYGLRDALVQMSEFDEVELDGVLIVVDEEFPDSIRLPAAA
jgi:anti-anti-sigma factor